jgi:hypothetical protein
MNWIIGIVVVVLLVVTYLSDRHVPSPTTSDEKRMTIAVKNKLRDVVGKDITLHPERTWTNPDYTVGGKFVASNAPELRDTMIFIDDYPSNPRFSIVDEISGEKMDEISKEKLSEIARRRGIDS